MKISKIHARLQKTFIGNFIVTPKPKQIEEPVVAVSPDILDGNPKSVSKKRVIFMGRDAVRQHKFNPTDVLISISDTGTAPPILATQPLEVLPLAFHDYVSAIEFKEFGWRKMDSDDGVKIVEFVLKHEDCNNIIVHCNYGQSRSKAAAIAISVMTGRSILHSDDYGRIAQYKESANSYYNRHVYGMILSEYECCQDN